jgi:hypothetical protein
MKRTYNVQDTTTGRWLYDWATSPAGRWPVWTHDRGKALRLDAYESALAVSSARAAGHPGAVRTPAQ